jgi:broad specificity phosphatase PhoE
LGQFEGRSAEDVYSKHPEYRDSADLRYFPNHFVQAAPGGESLTDVTNRVRPVLQHLDERCSGDVLVVSHYTTIRCMLGWALGLPNETVQQLRVPNATPIVLKRSDGFHLVDGRNVLGL